MVRRLFAFAFFCAAALPAQILRLAELNTEQIARLDRAKTVVLLPGGVLEEHGPYLPSFTDGYMNAWWTERLAEAIVARPGWTALVFPMLPLGDGGANEVGGKFTFPGTYGIRVETERAVYMDLGAELGEQGFRWVFIVQNHGSPLHNLMLDQAGDWFRDTYGGHMVNLCGLEPADAADPPPPTPEARAENGIDIHAGLSESSRILFLRPDLVSARIAEAPTQAGKTFPELLAIAGRADWPGYFGAPRLASAAYGAAVMQSRAAQYNALVLAILDGKDERQIPRFSTAAIAQEKAGVAASRAHDRALRLKQEAWLREHNLD